MNQQMPLERMLAGWMADEATGAPDAALEQILDTTRRSTPRPRIWALAAEPTMRRRTARAAVGLSNRGLVLGLAAALVLAALAALAIGASILLTPQPTPATGDWPGFRGGVDRAGTGLTGPAGNPILAWTYRAQGGVLEVAIVGDRVYFASDDGTVHAVSRDRGVEAWTATIPNGPLTGPFAGDGRLYLSDGDGRFHALAQDDGRVLWTSATTYSTPSRAIGVNGTLYFGTDDGSVVALDGASGSERWRVRPPGATHVDAPAFGDGRLFAGTAGGGFVAIDTATQAIVWTADPGTERTGTATVADGIAYIGANAQESSGSLHAFAASSGQPLWAASEPQLQFPDVADGVAYSASTTGVVIAIDTATGATRWRIELGGAARAPVVVDGVVYVDVGDRHLVFAIDAATGDLRWQFPIDGDDNCCLAVTKGMVFVGMRTGAVQAIAGDGTALARPRPTTGPTSTPAPTARPSVGTSPTPLPMLASVDWTTDLRDRNVAPICQIAIDPSGRIWAPEANGDKVAIFGPGGTLLVEWGSSGTGPGQFDFTRANRDGYGTLAFAKDGSFFVLDVGNRRIQRFDASRRFVTQWGTFGSRLGQYQDPVGIAVGPDGTVWVLDDVRSVVEHYTAEGRVLGSFDPFATVPVNGGANSLMIDAEGNLFVTIVDPFKVAVFDPGGTFLRFIGDGSFSEQPTHMAMDVGRRLYVTQGAGRGAAPGVLVFDMDGTLVGGFGPLGTGIGQVLFPAGIAVDARGGLIVEDSMPESARLIRFVLTP